MFVPQDDREDLGEVHVGFTPSEGIQTIHHVKEIPIQRQQSQSPAISQIR
jgi:hypothetical protein